MRYDLLRSDGLEIGYITDSPEFRWELNEFCENRLQIERFIKDSKQYTMVMAGGEMDADAVTPPEEDVPIDDTGRVIRLANELPGEFAIQVKRADEMDKQNMAQELTNIATKGPRDTKSEITEELEWVVKERVYVDDPSEVPEGVEPQEGDQGGVYYDTEQLGDETNEAEPWADVPFEDLGTVLQDTVGEDQVSVLVEELPDDADPSTAIDQLINMMAQSDEYSDDDINNLFRDLGEAFGEANPEDAPAPEEVGLELPGDMDIETAVGAISGVLGDKAANALFGDMRAPDSGEAPNPESYVTQAANQVPREARGQIQEAIDEAFSDQESGSEEEESGEGEEETDGEETQEEDIDYEELLPTVEEARDGDIDTETASEVLPKLPTDDKYWVSAEERLPDIGDAVTYTDGDGEQGQGFLTGASGFPDDGKYHVMTEEGEVKVPKPNLNGGFDPEGTEESSEEESDEAESQEEEGDQGNASETVSVDVSERPDREAIRGNVQEKLSQVDDPSRAIDFEMELELSNVTEEEVTEEGADVMRVSVSGAENAEQAEEFLVNAHEASDRGWLEGLSNLEMPSSNLHMPETATGAFDPGHKDLTGNQTGMVNPRVNINPEKIGEWDGADEYVPIDSEEVEFQQYALYHELGHHQHYENLKDEWDMDVDEIESDEFQDELKGELREHSDLITEEISALAAEQPFEFGAEVFATLATGNAELPQGIMDAYEAIGGVQP